MNKSKFLKRSLAALLAILMVVAMVPMSAFAAANDARTARAADPGYSIWVDNNEATWDSANDAYTAKAEFTEGSSVPSFKVSMKQNIPNTTVKVEKTGTKLSAVEITLDPADADSKSLTNSFGAGAYTYNMVSETTNTDGEVVSTFNFKLTVNVTMKAPSNDATIKAVKTAKMQYAIKATVDNNNNVINIIMALGKVNTHSSNVVNKDGTSITGSADAVTAALKEIFVPSSDDINAMTYGTSAGKNILTVTSENGDIKTYTVNYTSEDAFSTFKIGDYAGTIKENDPTTIYVDLPYDEFIDPTHTNGDENDVDLTKLVGVTASWTVPSNVVKVYENTDVIKSGEFEPDYGTAAPGADTDDERDYYVVELSAGHKVQVETKKSGSVAPVEMTIKLRIPQKNPSADLTGIQVGTGNQYYTINGETTSIDLPTGTKKTTNQNITVWGAYNATVELAKAADASQKFGAGSEPIDDADPGADPTEFTATSGVALDVSARLILKVTSEDEKTVKFYNIDVNDGKPTNPILKSLQFVDANGDVVATGTIKNTTPGAGTVDVTVPFATGIDLAELEALNIVAVADSSTKVEIANMTYTGVPAVGAAVAAECVSDNAITTSIPTAAELNVTGNEDKSGTVDGSFTVHGIAQTISFTISSNNSSGSYVHTVTTTLQQALTAWAAAYTTAQQDADTGDTGHWEAAIEGTDKIRFTYSEAGSKDTLGFTEPAGTTLVPDTGVDASPATVTASGNPDQAFVKAYSLDTAMGIDADLDGSGVSTTIPTVNVKNDPAAGNTFLMKVSNTAASNSATTYTVTVTKKAPNTSAAISGVQVIDGAKKEAVVLKTDVTYPASVSGRKITVNTLPYALQGVVNTMAFSQLDTSTGARVVWFDGTNVNLLEVTEDPLTASDEFGVWTSADDNWTKTGKEVVLYVYSEEAWHKIAGTPDTGDYNADRIVDLETYWGKVDAGTLDEDTDPLYPATATYKMSASYADPERNAVLNSIASTLDNKVAVAKESNTITITVPYSYVDASEAGATAFSLDIDVSKLATARVGANSDKIITSDEGSASTAHPTLFKVTGTQEAPVLNYSNDDGTTYNAFGTKMAIVNEAGVDQKIWNVAIKVADAETSAGIDSITVAGVRAVKDANDPYIWNLTMPANADQLQNISIVPTSKMAAILVDGDAYDVDNWYDLGADIQISVASEKAPGSPMVYTLKIIEGDLSNDASLRSVTVGDYTATKGSGTAWTVSVPEGTDMSALPLTIVTNNSDARITSVDGKAYTTGMIVDLSAGKTVSVVVTAANGDTVTYTIESAFGTTPPGPWENPFTDVKEGDWWYDAVKYVSENDLMIGDPNGRFNPRKNLTRAEFAQILYKHEGNPDTTWTDKFSDVTEKAWYAKQIIWAADKGILAGYSNGKAGPNDPITREQLVSLMWRYEGSPAPKSTTLNFSDAASVSNYAKDAMLWAVENGIISGTNGKLNPKGNAMRAEAAQILMQYFSNN